MQIPGMRLVNGGDLSKRRGTLSEISSLREPGATNQF